MEQRTEEWFKVRAGKVTASRIADVLAKINSGESASRTNYRAQLVAERLTGKAAESYSNSAMEWGINTEPMARSAYEAHVGDLTLEVGFVHHPTIKEAGCSPDGIIGGNLIEIKCPNTATHIETILSRKMPDKHIPQVQFQMACTGSQWCDFVSFDPRMPEHLQLFIYRVERDNKYIENMENEVMKFLSEVEETINKLENL